MCRRVPSKSSRPVVVHFETFGGASVLASRSRRVLTRQSRLVGSLAPPYFATGRRLPRCLTIDWHDCAWRPRVKVQFTVQPGAFRGLAGEGTGNGTIWWGEATDEPAREDARPTENCKIYHDQSTPWPGSAVLPPARWRIQFPTL